MLRANLVSAIASALPLSTKYVNFCQQRINALENGKVCLPPNLDDIEKMDPENAAKQLGRYIRNFDIKSCDTVRGFIKKREKGEMDKIFSEKDNDLEIKFVNLVSKMKDNYKKCIGELKEILEKLLNDELTNKDVQLLAEKTKLLLDKMYIECHIDYVLGVITLIQIDYRQPQISKEGEENLKKALDLRTS